MNLYTGENPRTISELISYFKNHNFAFWDGPDDQITKYIPLSVDHITLIVHALEQLDSQNLQSL